MNGTTCKVRFLPSGICAEVPHGATLLDAARQASIYVTSLCGGDGYCGKCRVIVENGPVEAKPTELLTAEDRAAKVFLACDTVVRGDLVVRIPEEHALETAQILTGSTTEAAGKGFRFEPQVRKFYLEMTPPTIEDNLSDHERIYSALGAEFELPRLTTDYAALREVPRACREGDWKVTATVANRWMEEFVKANFLPHTDLDRFPSVKAISKSEYRNPKQ